MAKLLLDAGADPNARDREFKARPVRWQVSDWRGDVVRLLEGVAGPDDDIGYEIATGENAKIAARLKADPSLAKTRTTNEVLGRDGNFLHIAARCGQAETTELLLNYGAEINGGGGFFNASALESACWAGYPEVVKVLLAHGTEVNKPIVSDQGTHTAIWWAALTGRKEIVALLLKAGATVEPELIDAVQRTAVKPYGGRALPPRADYDDVIDLLMQKVSEH